MVVVSLPPASMSLSDLAGNNLALQNNTAANLNTNNATVNLPTINSGLLNGLVNSFKANSTTAQQVTTPVAEQVSSLGQQLSGQINQTVVVGNTNNSASDNNLSTDVSVNNLNANLAKWQSYLADNDYSFTLTKNAAGQSTSVINVNVSNGQVTGASYADGSSVSAATLSSLPTMEQMFANIRQADVNGERADALYNPRYGYPEFVFFSHNGQISTDDESFILNNVRVNA